VTVAGATTGGVGVGTGPALQRPALVPPTADVVVVGGGHNGLVAACLLAAGGRSVVVLERSDHLGGAAVSAAVFPGVAARVSRYSYLLSLFPRALLATLGLDLRTVPRRVSSYTPDPTDPRRGLLVPADDPPALHTALRELTGSDADAEAWQRFYGHTAAIARAVFPSLTEPLVTRAQLRQRVGDAAAWDALVTTPIGDTLDVLFGTGPGAGSGSDLVKGVVATDALIGTSTSLHDPSLLANRCLVYHTIGNGTGDWDVPIGGMGALTDALAARASALGVRLVTSSPVTAVVPGPTGGEVFFDRIDTALGEQRITAGHVLVNAAPQVLDELVTHRPRPATESWQEGAQLKVNMLLTRLPALRDRRATAADAFVGTFHINETKSQLEAAHREGAAGRLPDPVPAEVYCHTLSDRSILSPELAAAGAHTLTLFGLHVPHRLAAADPEGMRAAATRAALASLDSVLAEPIADCLALDATGRPCLDVATTVDLERTLALLAGNIFHTPLDWPWAEPDDPRGSWGVATAYPSVSLCGSGAARGGAVSGIPGHNAAMALLRPQPGR